MSAEAGRPDADDAPVTVVFTDVVTSSDLRTRLGDSAARPVLDANDEILNRTVVDHRGKVVKSVGDGVLATFRSPRRAVEAAVAIQQTMGARIGPGSTGPLQIRIGIHAGEALVRRGDVVGTAVNAAARIVALARPGEILVSDVVRHLIGPGPDLVFVERGTFALQGFPGKWRLHQAVWDGSVAAPAPEVVTAPIIDLAGRADALRTTDAALDAAFGGAPQLVLLAGEAGIGKSTIARALAGRALDRGARVVWGVAWDGEGAPPFWPWIQAIEACLPLVDGDVPRPEIARLLPDQRTVAISEPSVRDPDEARFRLFDAVTSLLHEAAAQEPLVVILDDLHWADAATLRLLAFAARRPGSARLLLVGAYRDVDAAGDADLAPLFGDLAHLGEVISLAGLGPMDVGALLAGVTGHAPPAEVVASVHERTAGNPFFVREVGRLFAMHGEATGIPDGVRDLVERRLLRMSPTTVELLTVAAVVGQESPVDLLAAVSGRSLAELLDPLDDAVRARILAEPPSPLGPYRFAHDLFRESIYARLPASRRAALHLEVADAMEAIASRAVHPADLARHLAMALPLAPLERVIDSARAAARHATRQLAYEEAAGHLERAVAGARLDTTRPLGDRIGLGLELADALARAGRAEAASSAYRTAIDEARAANLDQQLVAAVLAYQALGSVTGGVDHREREMLLGEAVHAAGADDSVDRARLLAAAARHRVHTATIQPKDGALGHAEEAVAIARRIGEPLTLAEALHALHDVSWAPGNADARLEILEEMLRAARAAGADDLVFQAHELRLTAYLTLGDLRARGELDELARVGRRLRLPRRDWWVMTREAGWAIMTGELVEGERVAEAARELGTTIGEPDALLVHQCHLAEIYMAQHRMAELLPFIEALPDQHIRSAKAALRATVVAWTGNAAPVADLVGAQLHGRVDLTLGPHDIFSLTWFIRALVNAGDTRHSHRLYELYLPFAGENIVAGGAVVMAGAVDHYLGLLADSLGDDDAAIGHFEVAVDRHDRLGARLWSVQTRVALGRLLAGRDPRRAREMLEVARDAAGAMGMSTFEADASAALATLDDKAGAPILERHGRLWQLTFAGRTAHVADSKGMRDLARLVASPDVEVHTAELVAVDEAGTAAATLDDHALAAYRRRLAELERDVEDAEDDNDLARAERARDERDALLDELRRSVGLGGKARRLGDPGERARKAVSARIRDAIARVEAVHPALGAHLRDAVSTGTFCCYRQR